MDGFPLHRSESPPIMSDRTERDHSHTGKPAYYATPRRKPWLRNWLFGIGSTVAAAAVLGGAGWLTNLASAQSDLAERQAVSEQRDVDIQRRLERIENKVDRLLNSSARKNHE